VGVSGGNVGGMNAAVERTGMYSQRFPEETPTVSDLCGILMAAEQL
jgi:hypothetical protein